jgi:Na+/proline symporter
VVVALASLVVFPEITDHKLAYPMLLNDILPAGLKGVCVAMFLAAFMSTIDTHLNWGASYLVNDIYKRFVRRDATERHFVAISRLTMFLLAIVTGLVAFFLIESISGAWLFLWAMGSGIGLVLILRWFWWRINAWSEIAALSTSLLGATGLYLYEALSGNELPYYIKLPAIVFASIAVWVPVTLFTGPERPEVIKRFCERVRPSGLWPGNVAKSGLGKSVLLAWLGGVATVYGCLFAVGHLIVGSTTGVTLSVSVAVAGGAVAWIGLRNPER